MTDHDDAAEQPDEKPRQDTLSAGPQATDHPAGEKQAAENEENEPVS